MLPYERKEMKFKTKPYAHQLKCLEKFGSQKSFALLAEMGTGKTWIIINNAADLWLQGKCDAVLVFAPNGVHTNWTRLEIPKHMPDSIPYEMASWSANPCKDEKQEMRDLYDVMGEDNIDGFSCRVPLRIFTMNWESLQTKKGIEAAERFCKSSQKLMIVCDESDSIKNPKAKRTKALMKLASHAKWRRIMTGTPINNSPFDAFSQFSFLDPKILKTTSFWAFKAEYAEMLRPDNHLLVSIRQCTGRAPQIVARGSGGRPKYKNLDQLAALIAPHSFRVLKKDCLDLPDKIYKTLFFDLTPEQQVVYKKCEKECRLVFDNEETPFNKLVAITKLAQITSGYYIHPSSPDPIRISGKTPKLDLLTARVQRVVEEGSKVIVWARYRIEIADIVERLTQEKISCVEYHGGIGTKEREEAIDDFENGEAQVFIGNPQAGGMGITLVAANCAIYFSNDFSYRRRAQSEDRSHRIGQKQNVTYINIAAKGTIDEKIIGALLDKQDIAETIIDRGVRILE